MSLPIGAATFLSPLAGTEGDRNIAPPGRRSWKGAGVYTRFDPPEQGVGARSATLTPQPHLPPLQEDLAS